MSEHHFDRLEGQDPDRREADLFARLPGQISHAMTNAPGLSWSTRNLRAFSA